MPRTDVLTASLQLPSRASSENRTLKTLCVTPPKAILNSSQNGTLKTNPNQAPKHTSKPLKKKLTPMTIPDRKPGRPSEYKPEYDELAEQVCKAVGATDKALAVVFKLVDEGVIGDWRRAHPSFELAIKRGRDACDVKSVERSLMRRAMGYEYDEISEACSRGSIQGDSTRNTVTKRHVMPDVGAIIFHLCNRNPERWKNIQRQMIDVQGKVKHEHVHSLDLSRLPRTKLEQLRSIVAEASEHNPGSRRLGGSGKTIDLSPMVAEACEAAREADGPQEEVATA